MWALTTQLHHHATLPVRPCMTVSSGRDDADSASDGGTNTSRFRRPGVQQLELNFVPARRRSRVRTRREEPSLSLIVSPAARKSRASRTGYLIALHALTKQPCCAAALRSPGRAEARPPQAAAQRELFGVPYPGREDDDRVARCATSLATSESRPACLTSISDQRIVLYGEPRIVEATTDEFVART